MTQWIRASLRAGLVALVLVAFVSMAAFAQGDRAANRAFVAGEVLITVPHGTPLADVQTAAAAAQATVARSWLAIDFERTTDAYLLRLSRDLATEQGTLDAVQALKARALVRYAAPNYRYFRLQGLPGITPNDPRFREQWDKQLIRMPQAWAVEKGKDNVIVAIIDDAVDIDHPEFKNRYVTGYNGIDQGTDPRPPAANVANMSHGTHVTGIAIATPNNSIGVAGNVWEGAMLMPMRSGADDGTLSSAGVMNCYAELLKRRLAMPDKQFVLNLSLGRAAAADAPDPNNLAPDEQAVMNLAKNGVVVCAGAGNDFENGNPPFTPANLCQISPNIISVAAVGPQGTHASYSTARPYTTIAAPGGDVAQGKQILSTFPVANGSYGELEGTSMASPQVAGAVALLLSVPGVKPEDVKGIVTSTARPVPGATIPSPEYGYGVLDVAAALLKVSVAVTVVEPDGAGGKASQGGLDRQPDPVETLRPTVRIQVSQITPDNLTIKLNESVFTDYVIENIVRETTDDAGGQVPYSYDVVIKDRDFSPGQNRVDVTGTNPGPPERTVSDTRTFIIKPHEILPGRSLISIPYFQDGATPETYFGSDFRLARWVPTDAVYAPYFPGGMTDPRASFAPPGVAPRVDGGAVRPPVGLAYWIDTDRTKPVLTRGQAVSNRTFVVPLKGTAGNRNISWNMVGDPFPFDVPFNAVLVDTPEGRLTIGDAVASNYLLPNIYSYDGASGYTFRTLPDGALRAWAGHWIGVTSKSDIALVVPPAKTTRAASRAGATGAGGTVWTLQLAASTGALNDAHNYIGVSSRSADGFDLADVPKPPMLAPYVSLSLNNESWGGRAGQYARDLRGPGGVHVWSALVNTDQADSDVTVRWSGVGSYPRGVKLTLKDEATGQVYDMRTRSSMTFHTGSDLAPRRLTITARPGTDGVIRISNLTVRSAGGRSAGTTRIAFTLSSDATYDVKVLGADGRPIGTVASRAATAGDVSLVWNGKDAAGRSVPAGTYLVQIRALGSDGEVVRAIQPFALVR